MQRLASLVTVAAAALSHVLLPTAAAGTITIDLGRGPVDVVVPSTYDPATPAPLILLLHGYQTTGAQIEDWLQFTPLGEEFGFIFAAPDGDTDFFGLQYWDATDACCDIFNESPDDSGYLRALVDEIKTLLNVDDRRVYFAGHSNGGFMSYRMACDHADVVAAVASLAGATFLDAGACVPSVAVDVLQIHGTSDDVILYGGGCLPFLDCYPGAVATVEQWAEYDGCDIIADDSEPPLDLVASIGGAETDVSRYTSNCAPGGSAELWTMNGAPHSPSFTADFSRLVVEFLLAHPKPLLCPADLDGSGDVGVTDLLDLLAAWGTTPGGPPDFDGGGVGVTDLLELLAGWGSCG